MRIRKSVINFREKTMARNKVQFQKGLSDATFSTFVWHRGAMPGGAFQITLAGGF